MDEHERKRVQRAARDKHLNDIERSLNDASRMSSGVSGRSVSPAASARKTL